MNGVGIQLQASNYKTLYTHVIGANYVTNKRQEHQSKSRILLQLQLDKNPSSGSDLALIYTDYKVRISGIMSGLRTQCLDASVKITNRFHVAVLFVLYNKETKTNADDVIYTSVL